ncbi:glycosyltransferase [Microbacterium dauci]|uniref:Glycosyltransferase n=1 Tax=Microbacterium dauci TaxID=3048008 RepID=A0ABT6ZFU1_9MICO|nr:glycosyltransferase [Microbacterium sp. LX3-4]MDJ1114497.1 glycosyltransferase [Microbacterium sp. LX3-4]
MSRRIAFVLPSLLGGGAEFVAATWAQELTVRGYEVEIVLLRARPEEPELSGVTVISASREGVGRRGETAALRRYLAGSTAELVISMMTRANIQLLREVARLAADKRPRVAISERNIPFAERSHSALHVAARNLAFRRLYRKADAFIAISHPVGAVFAFAGDLPGERVWVVPNPAVGKVGSYRAREAAASSQPIHLVIPGRLVDKKRPHLALEIAARVATEHPVEGVTFFGAGPLDASLASAGGDVPVHLAGRVENWFEALPPNAVCLLPSAVEGFGNVLLEAASQGVPCVVGSTAYGSADALVPGVSGAFARSDSVDEYAHAVLEAHRQRTDVPAGWLDVFSTRGSTDVLERAIRATLAR